MREIPREDKRERCNGCLHLLKGKKKHKIKGSAMLRFKNLCEECKSYDWIDKGNRNKQGKFINISKNINE